MGIFSFISNCIFGFPKKKKELKVGSIYGLMYTNGPIPYYKYIKVTEFTDENVRYLCKSGYRNLKLNFFKMNYSEITGPEESVIAECIIKEGNI